MTNESYKKIEKPEFYCSSFRKALTKYEYNKSECLEEIIDEFSEGFEEELDNLKAGILEDYKEIAEISRKSNIKYFMTYLALESSLYILAQYEQLVGNIASMLHSKNLSEEAAFVIAELTRIKQDEEEE